MDRGPPGDLSTTAKLVRLVLHTQGPLSPREIATEAHLSPAETQGALAELADAGVAESVCGVAATREEVYALTESVGT